IFQQNLLAANTRRQLIAEAKASFAQRIDKTVQVFHDKLNPIPAAGFRPSPVRHRLCRSTRAADGIDQKIAFTLLKYSEKWSGMSFDGETEMLRVKSDRLIHIVDKITNTDGSHSFSFHAAG